MYFREFIAQEPKNQKQGKALCFRGAYVRRGLPVASSAFGHPQLLVTSRGVPLVLAPATGDDDSLDARVGWGGAARGAGAAPWRPRHLPRRRGARLRIAATPRRRAIGGRRARRSGSAVAPGEAIRSAPRLAAANVARVFLLSSAGAPSCLLPSPSARCHRHAVGMSRRFVPSLPASPHFFPLTSSSTYLAPPTHSLVELGI